MIRRFLTLIFILSSVIVLSCGSGGGSADGDGGGEGGGSNGGGDALVPFQRTASDHSWDTPDFDAVCSEAFGVEYRMADWTEIEAYISANSIDEFYDMTGMADYRSNGWVSRGGQGLQTSGRHYFIERHNGTVPSGWAVFDSIGGNDLDLGSWYNSRPVICTCVE